MKRILILLTLLLPLAAVAQRYTISGTVTDAKSGETLIGATIIDNKSGKGTVTNPYGRYSLTLQKGDVDLKVQYVGYETQSFLISLDRNRELNVRLVPSVQLDEVTIVGERVGDTKSSQMSATVMTVEKIKSVPVMFGEADIIKALQLMPGVQSGSEGNSGMYVRGGGPDENLFLLDGVPLYNVSHLGGFFSTFNTDAVKNVTLYKGSFPARFGGRLSSVLDITQNNGNDQELHGNASIGLISAKLNLEGPIVKEKTTFSLSGRRTYAELLVIPTIAKINAMTADEPTSDLEENAKYDAGYYFYDFNAKLTHKFSDRSRLYGSFYMGADRAHGSINTVTSLNEDMYLGFENAWGNMVGALRWNYALTPKTFANVSVAYTQYNNVLIGDIEKKRTENDANPSTVRADYRTAIQDLTMRVDFDYTPNPSHNIKYGGFFIRHWFSPEVVKASINYRDSIQMNGAYQVDSTLTSETVMANEMVAFVEDDWALSETVKLNMGLHASGFRVKGVFYPSLQPRVSGRVMVTDELSVKAGYAWMKQYVHLLSTTGISMPTDLWVPVTDRVEPMESHQWAGGVFYSRSGIADFSIEGYYKRMSNLIEYKDGATFFGSSENWENLVVAGDGWSYGVELLVQRDIGKLTGWVGYTWSRTMRLFKRDGQELNGGEPFPAKYDRRHDLSIVLSYKFSNRCDVSATWVFSTGNTATLATKRYAVASDDPDDYDRPTTEWPQLSYIEGRNNYRLPNYHRLDVGANFHRTFKAWGRRFATAPHRTISVSVYNVYNRQNPYMVYRSNTPSQYYDYSSSFVQLSLFPILPSAAYTLYF
jgi:outer membrane receptor for ferrienterochelin and colicin